MNPRLISIIHKEFLQILRDPRTLAIIVILPIMQIFLLGYAATNDVRNIALAGQTPTGEDACNDLTTMCLEASAKLMLPEPKLNVRFCAASPARLLRECCRVMAKGANTLSFFNDEVAVPAAQVSAEVVHLREHLDRGGIIGGCMWDGSG